MYVAGQRGQILDVADVLLIVEDGLIQVADAPAQRDVVVEELRQLGSSLARIGVAPSAERHHYFLLLVEGHVAVHHGRETDGGQRLYLAVVLLLHILAQFSVAVLQTVPYGLGGVSPKSVYQLVFPLVRTLCNGLVVLIDEDGLDSCGTKLDSQYGFASLDSLFCSHLLLQCFVQHKVKLVVAQRLLELEGLRLLVDLDILKAENLGKVLPVLFGDVVRESTVVRTTGQYPCAGTNLERRLRNPQGTGHGQVGHGLRLDALHFLTNQAEAIAQVDDGGLDTTTHLRCEHQASGLLLADADA